MKRLASLILFLFLLPLPSLAFDYNYIISDKELEDVSSMSIQDIKNFLSDHNSFLQYYADFYPENGAFMEAPEIIWQTAQKFHINPKFILTLLEKEQGLVSFQKPSTKRLDWAVGYAVCDKCLLSHPLVVQYKGFAKQVYGAAQRIREIYLTDLEKRGKTQNGFGVGITKKVDSYKVTPLNKATAILYTYTPHLAGNKSFYTIWKNWFSDLKYPDGSLLQDVKSGGVYLIQDGKKRAFITETAFTSRFNENQIVEATPSFLSRYPDGDPIKFDNFSLLRDENKNIYLFADEKLRPFDSVKTIKALGLDANKIKDVATAELMAFSLGEPMTTDSIYPTGELMQMKSTGGVYWVYSGIKYPILDKSLLKTLFSGDAPTKVNDSQLGVYGVGQPLRFKDGTLIRGKKDPSVYFVSNGKLRPIPSEEIFLAYNWNWSNVISTADKVLSLYEIGAPITLEGDAPTETNTEFSDPAETEETEQIEMPASDINFQSVSISAQNN